MAVFVPTTANGGPRVPPRVSGSFSSVVARWALVVHVVFLLRCHSGSTSMGFAHENPVEVTSFRLWRLQAKPPVAATIGRDTGDSLFPGSKVAAGQS